MIDLETIDKVYLYPGSTDLRKGMNALSYLVGELEKEDHLHKLFLFCNRKNDRSNRLLKHLKNGKII